MPAHLLRKEALGPGLLRCLQEDLEEAASALAQSHANPSEKEVHRVRQRLKRARADLRLLRTLNGAFLPGDLGRCLRDAGRALSRSRDARVALTTLGRLSSHRKARRRELSALREALDRKLIRVESSKRPAESAFRLIHQCLVPLRSAEVPSFSQADLLDGLTQLYRRTRKARRAHRRDAQVSTLHEWRKRTKDLYYALRITRKVFARAGVELSAVLDRLGDVLGRRLDLEVLARLARVSGGVGIPPMLVGVLQDERGRLDRRIQRTARGVFNLKPGLFRRNLDKRTTAKTAR